MRIIFGAAATGRGCSGIQGTVWPDNMAGGSTAYIRQGWLDKIVGTRLRDSSELRCHLSVTSETRTWRRCVCSHCDQPVPGFHPPAIAERRERGVLRG